MISDQANYEKIVETYENKEPGSPFFLFDVTMQNHSGYTNRYFQADINCNGYDSDEADQYFSLLKLSDEAISYLIRYFQQVDEPTMIIMFGDHSPNCRMRLKHGLPETPIRIFRSRIRRSSMEPRSSSGPTTA